MWVLRIRGIEESSVYQAIDAEGYAKGRAKGRAEAAREVLIRLGRKKWSEPDERVRRRIIAIEDLARLELLIVRIFNASASSWDELFPPAESSM